MRNIFVKKDAIKKVDEWMEYISHFNEPIDDIERMRCHYLCYNWEQSFIKVLTLNVISFPLLIISVIVSCIKSCFNRNSYIKSVDAIALIRSGNNILAVDSLGIPKSLEDEYKNIEFIHERKRVKLFEAGVDKCVLSFFFNILIKYPFSYYMLLLLWIHIVKFNRIIRIYNPKAIITTQLERDITSSVITMFCEKNDVKNISIMHGEYLVNTKAAFVRFSSFFIWDEWYLKQFEVMRCPLEQFIIYNPNRFKMNIIKDVKFDVCYYLQLNKDGFYIRLKAILVSLQKKGYKCIVRPHPRDDVERLKKIFGEEIEIEDSSEVSIEESLGRSKYIVSQYSTVLSEAISNGLLAVVDDLTDVEYYNYLEKVLYINIVRNNLRFSDIAKKSTF